MNARWRSDRRARARRTCPGRAPRAETSSAPFDACAAGPGVRRRGALAILQEPGILHAGAAAAACGLHALFERVERAALRDRCGVADAPGTVNFSDRRPGPDHDLRKQDD